MLDSKIVTWVVKIKKRLFLIFFQMFKFNFNQEEEETVKNEDIKGNPDSCKQHELQGKTVGDIVVIEMKVEKSDTVINYVKSSDAINQIKNKPKYLEQNTDLVKNVYEGGLKIWECSHDLVQFLCSSQVPIKDQQILELGCGAALPGLYCLHQNASVLHLQDYNTEVIDYITAPNVLMNRSTDHPTQVQLFSGDWLDFTAAAVQDQQKYDVILTSETIYEESNYGKLIQCFKDCLAPEGVVYLAAKIHYFGVGGGLRSFEKALDKSGLWTHEIVFENNDSVHRQIIKIKHKP